jgi:hypothetical protein
VAEQTVKIWLTALGAAMVIAACAGPPTLAPDPVANPGAWFLEVEGEGGTWLGPEGLRAMGVEVGGEAAPSLRLAWGGREIPYLPRRTGEGWGAFFFVTDRSTRTSQRTAIRVELGLAGTAMPSEEQVPVSGATPAGGLFTEHWEEDRRYVPQAETETPWFWEALRTPSTGGVTETVVLPGALSGPVTVTLHLWSHTAAPANPDHRLRLTWDGRTVGEWEWDGQGMQYLTTSFAGSGEKEHTMTLETPAAPGAEVALVWLDGWEVTYRRRVSADGSVWRAEGDAMGVGEAGAGARVVDVTDPFAPRDLGPVASGELVDVTPSHRYWVGVPEEAPSPVAVRAAQSLDVDGLEEVAYLAVAPPAFHDPLEALLDHRRSQGLAAAVVDVQAVYDTVGVGQPDAEALRTLVDRLPSLEYLLLVGDGTAEPGGTAGEVGSLRVVTPFTRTATLGETPADGLLGVDAEGEPTVAVGRFPATSVDEVRAMVAKTIEWESESEPPQAVLVSDDEAEFANLAEKIGAALPPGALAQRLDAGEEGSRGALVEALQQGPVWMNYTGHGSLTLLCDEGLLRLEDGESWREPALVVAWTCLAAHYVHPTQDSMAEVWLRTRRGGAVAFLGPVGETTSREQEPFLQSFYGALGERERLGDAWLAALQEGRSDDVRWGYVLLGDPALLLNLE